VSQSLRVLIPYLSCHFGSSWEQLSKQNSKGSASKRNNEKMGWHQTKELLHSEGNSHQTQDTAHRMGEIFVSYSSDKGTKKISAPKELTPQ
jgi:hypothetical protein